MMNNEHTYNFVKATLDNVTRDMEIEIGSGILDETIEDIIEELQIDRNTYYDIKNYMNRIMEDTEYDE